MPTLEEAILIWLRNSRYPDEDYSAKQIAQELHENRSSVRVNLSRLVKRGDVERTKYGYYRIRPGYAVGGGVWREVRVQHLHFWVDEIKVRDEDWGREELIEFPEVSGVDPARIRVEFGGKRGKLHWWVKADAGLDFYGLNLARIVVEERLLRLGYRPPMDWSCEGWETLADKFGIRLEGVSCVTYSTLSGWLEKHYDKGYGVRREIRAPSRGDATLESLNAMLQGGVNYGQLLQMVANTHQELNRVLTYLEQNNRLLEAVVKSKK